MPGVNPVAPRVQGGLLSQVLQGVQIARDIYGIKTDMVKNDAAEADTELTQQKTDQGATDFEQKQAGIQPASEKIKAYQFGVPATAETPGAVKLQFQGDDSPLYMVARGEKTPLEKIANYKDPGTGAVGTGMFDSKGNLQGFVPQVAPAKEQKIVQVHGHDADGNETVQFVPEVVGGTYTSPKVVPKPTADQFKAGGFAKRMDQAEDVFTTLTTSGYDRTGARQGILSYAPGVMKPDNLKSQEQAERNFVNALLRRESGAAISNQEFSSAETQYFPRAGDTAEVLAQKEQNRKQATATMAAEAGPALAAIPTVAKKDVKKDHSGEALGDTSDDAVLKADQLKKVEDLMKKRNLKPRTAGASGG